jgi:hypothetical protein
VAGCAFRSVFPVFDVPRLCLFDTWISSVLVGRSVATIAEICFVTQWALMLRQCSRMSGDDLVGMLSVLVVPLIVVAESCSWYAVLTTSNGGHVIENSLWGVSAGLIVLAMIRSSASGVGVQRGMLPVWSAAGIAYVAFMFLHDVPMYWSRWFADRSMGHPRLTLTQGLVDAAHRRIVSHDWQDWHSEMAWMSLYFSVAVWASISLAYSTGLAAARALPAEGAGADGQPGHRLLS